MRVIGYIPHPVLKITVFETDGRFPVQFEAGNVQQTYRFRKGGVLEGLADVKELVDEAMCDQVSALLLRQSKLQQTALRKRVQAKGPGEDDDLPSII